MAGLEIIGWRQGFREMGGFPGDRLTGSLFSVLWALVAAYALSGFRPWNAIRCAGLMRRGRFAWARLVEREDLGGPFVFRGQSRARYHFRYRDAQGGISRFFIASASERVVPDDPWQLCIHDPERPGVVRLWPMSRGAGLLSTLSRRHLSAEELP